MRSSPYDVVKQFEQELCEFTGAPYAVSVTSCTAALLLACSWHFLPRIMPMVEIPKYTYISVPMSIINAGGKVAFRNQEWSGEYRLRPFPIWDCARWLRADMYLPGQMMCLSFHWSKQLAISQGGAILLDDKEAYEWLKRARFDGRTEGVAPKDDTFTMIGHHCYMSPSVAAEGLSRLALLPRDNPPLPNDDYPDLSKMDIFK